jgi:hypothetical protein
MEELSIMKRQHTSPSSLEAMTMVQLQSWIQSCEMGVWVDGMAYRHSFDGEEKAVS